MLAIVVKFPFARRPWALPGLCALYRPEELNKAEGRRHKEARTVSRTLTQSSRHLFRPSVVSLIYHDHRNRKNNEPELGHRPGYEKLEPTFSDALSDVRRLFWTETFFQQAYFSKTFKKFPRR